MTFVKGRIPFQERKKNALLLASMIALIILIVVSYQGLRQQTMIRYAAMNDNGKKNLLVLSPNPKYIGQTDFSVLYNADGSVLISGKADERAWIEIGRVTLPAGNYRFSGLSGTPEKTIAIELEYYDRDQDNYLRLTQDVCPVYEDSFELTEKTKLRALIGLYAGAEGEFLACPVIFEED